jgi:hypothetical protein
MATIIGTEKELIDGNDSLLSARPESHISILVLFTSTDLTMIALNKAREIAKDLGAAIVVVAAQVVPFPAPLDQPPVRFEFVIKQFEEAVRDFGNIRFCSYLCRDQFEAYKRILNRKSPVVIGVRKRWWPTYEERLARRLQRAGCQIILAKTE